MDEEGNYAYYGKDNPFDFGFSFNLLDEPNYKYFDIKSLPWRSFPDYIQSILKLKPDTYMPYLTDVSADQSVYTKSIPFVLVRAYGTNLCDIYVGYNVFIGRYNDTSGNLNVFARTDIDSACYYARFDFDGNTIMNWSELSLHTPWSSSLGYYQTYAIGNFERVVDYYFYGGNVVKPTDTPLSSLSYQGLNSSGLTVTGLQSDIGFTSQNFFPLQDQYSYIYSSSFEIPDYNELLQQEQNELIEDGNKTSKGIWETLKGIPEAIGEKIKGLFVPSDGFFDTYQQEFQTYFRERFGLLYEIPELVINLLTKFVTFNPKEDDYSITFPEVKLPVLEDGEWREEKLIEAQEFSFDFINEAPFSLLYDAYVAFIWLVYILLLVNLIKYKANSVFKGG